MSADKEKLVKLIRGEKKKKKGGKTGKKSFSIRTEIRFERIVPVGKSRFSLNGEHRRRSGTGERNFAPTTKEISVTRFGRHERLFQTLQQARVYIPSFHRVTKHEFPHLSFPPPPLVDRSLLDARPNNTAHDTRYEKRTRPTPAYLPFRLFDRDIVTVCPRFFAQIFRSLSRSRFFRHIFSLLPRYLIFIGGIFQRYFFSAPGNTALLYIYVYVCVYYIRATLKNIKLAV